MPTVSVIITTYNHAHYILESIASVLNQTFSDYEIIVVDDGSADDTRKVLEPMVQAGKIRYVYQENQGKSVARNVGVETADGKYVAFHDADDVFHPEKLAKQVAFLEDHPEVALVHSCYSKFDDAGNDLGYRDTSKISGWVYPEILLDWSVLMGVPCVMVRADVMVELGGFDPRMIRAQDLDMWRRIARQYPIGVVSEALSKIRVYPENQTGSKITLALPFFEMYLNKAFEEDPDLDDKFQRLAFANLYTNVGHNYLARGNQDEMHLVRKYCLKAIRYRPLQLGTYAGWLGSWLGPDLRNRLLAIWRKNRYRKG